MDILGTARRLEAALSARFDRAAQRVRAGGPRTPLEVAHAIVEAVTQHVQPGGRGRYVFPYNRVKVTVLAVTKDARARLEAVLDGEPSIDTRIIERLDSAGCDVRDLDVRVTYAGETDQAWVDRDFHLELMRQTDRPRATRPADTPALELAVEHGTADQERYSFATTPVYLGRCADVRDSRHRLIRANQVAFLDTAVEANASISRQHAHITYDAASGHRLCDDRSAHGTSILRAGRITSVPAGTRGIRIQSGDVIILGDARIRVTLSSPGLCP